MQFRLLFHIVALLSLCSSPGCYALGQTMGEWDRDVREAVLSLDKGYDDGRSACRGMAFDSPPLPHGGQGRNGASMPPDGEGAEM